MLTDFLLKTFFVSPLSSNFNFLFPLTISVYTLQKVYLITHNHKTQLWHKYVNLFK
jgi:hypothetical protein